jgi:predicted metal-dependent phosphoesterase TrpH
MKYADLHIHTIFSDGTFTPERTVRHARQLQLSCIAITDHDTVGAIGRAQAQARDLNIEVIAGVELTTEIDDQEMHILGYCIDWQKSWFKQKLEEICNVRRSRALAIIEKLKTFGITLDPAELLKLAGPDAVGRLHIARMMQAQGFVHSIQEAFNKYIGNGRACFVKRFKLTPLEAIKMIASLNGLAVLAHPCTIGNDELIFELVHAGLRGLEVYYPEHNQATRLHYKNLAQKYGLLITGGSDCHGSKDRLMMGEVKVPYSLVDELKKEAEAIRSGQR